MKFNILIALMGLTKAADQTPAEPNFFYGLVQSVNNGVPVVWESVKSAAASIPVRKRDRLGQFDADGTPLNWNVHLKPKGIERRYDEATYRIYGRIDEMKLEAPRKAVMKNHVMSPRMPLKQEADGE